MDTGRLERVLIIKPSSLGDVIHALPVAAAIKTAYPDAKVDWVVSAAYAGLLEGNPDIDRVIVFDRGMLKGGSALTKLVAFVSELRRMSYDVVLDLQGLLRSGLMSFAARSGKRAGFANAREGAPVFYNLKVPVPNPDVHAVDRYMSVLDVLGIPHGEPEFRLVPSEADFAESDAILNDAGIGGGSFVAVAPSARWTSKRWPASMFVELAGMLNEGQGLRSVFVGTAKDADLFKGLEGDLGKSVAAAFGKTSVMSLAALFSRAALVITNDSGPMHIAAAMGTPTLALFGPTDPRRTGPYGENSRTLTASDDCAPCFKRECDNVKCLTGISVSRVYDEAVSMIEEGVCR